MENVYIVGTGAVGLGFAGLLQAIGQSPVGLYNRGDVRRKEAAAATGLSVAENLKDERLKQASTDCLRRG
ncbi:MAG: 2-dehydropantoate 2-reductase N-terminal domain-containing protein [Myxococcota bacterium]